MPSFDMVSEINIEEVRNAVENSSRELSTRFDFRGVDASFEFVDGMVKLTAEGDFQLQQMRDILQGKCAKRNVDAGAMEAQDVDITGKTYRQSIVFKQGIATDVAKKIVKHIKDAKMKVQASIQGEQSQGHWQEAR